MIDLILAQAATTGLDPVTVGTIIGGIITALIGGGLIGKRAGKTEGKAEAMQIGPQPFMVELKEQFVTRREFDRLESVMAVNAAEMKGLFQQTMGAMAAQNTTLMKRIENQNDRLTRKIEEVAAGAYQGRQRLHNTQNEHTGKIAALEAVSDVAGQIGKLAEAMNPQTHVQPTHANKS